MSLPALRPERPVPAAISRAVAQLRRSGSLDEGRVMLRRAFDLGITHFDLANNYGPPPGSAEETFGRALKLDLAAYRDELIVSDESRLRDVAGALWRLGSRKYLLASLDQA